MTIKRKIYNCKWCDRPIFKGERTFFINIAEDTTFPLQQIQAYHVCYDCINERK